MVFLLLGLASYFFGVFLLVLLRFAPSVYSCFTPLLGIIVFNNQILFHFCGSYCFSACCNLSEEKLNYFIDQKIALWSILNTLFSNIIAYLAPYFALPYTLALKKTIFLSIAYEKASPSLLTPPYLLGLATGFCCRNNPFIWSDTVAFHNRSCYSKFFWPCNIFFYFYLNLWGLSIFWNIPTWF